MTDIKKNAPTGSILEEMLIDIYASKEDDEVSILVDRRFQKELTRLELDPVTHNLTFIFGNERRDLGVPVKDELVPYFEKVSEIAFFLIDMKKKEATDGWLVPFEITESPSPAQP